MSHLSIMPPEVSSLLWKEGIVSIEENIQNLCSRCEKCSNKIKNDNKNCR